MSLKQYHLIRIWDIRNHEILDKHKIDIVTTNGAQFTFKLDSEHRLEPRKYLTGLIHNASTEEILLLKLMYPCRILEINVPEIVETGDVHIPLWSDISFTKLSLNPRILIDFLSDETAPYRI